MKKKNIFGEPETYGSLNRNSDSWVCENGTPPRIEGGTEPNMTCSCGSTDFKVCWWDYPYTGGYCKLVCSKCGESMVLIDDYS